MSTARGTESIQGPVRGASIVLDVGGTTMAATIVHNDALAGPRFEVPSQADAETPGPILDALTGLVLSAVDSADANGLLADLAVVCFPAPFDYVAGRSLMTHKFGALFELDLRSILESAADCEVAFANDADAFAAGAWVRAGRALGRAGGATLGTGLGSAFLTDGDPAHSGAGIPAGGEIWSLRYRDGILEDWVSAQALRLGYHRAGGDPDIDVQEIARRAAAGDSAASLAFAEYGEHLGHGIALGFKAFAPHRLAIGGKMARAWPFFGPTTERIVEADGLLTHLDVSVAGGEAFIGGHHIGRRQRSLGLLDRRRP